MSQYNSFMFSDAVYLFGTTFSSLSRGGFFQEGFWYIEELPDGTMVDQKKLAEQAVLAAFAYLYNKKLIDIVLGEKKAWRFTGKYFFIIDLAFLLKRKTTTARVKKLQSSAPDTSGLEAVIFTHIQDNSDIWGLTLGLLRSAVSNPWGDVLEIVKKNLLERGILKQVEKGKVLFRTTYKNVVNEDISKEEKQVTELKKTLNELQSKGELYQQILSDIENGIASLKTHVHG